MSTRRPGPVGRILDEIHLAAAEPHFPAALRTWIRDTLDGCTSGAIGEATVVLDALVTNAFRHAVPPYRVRLAAARRGHMIQLAVADGTPDKADGWRLGRGLIIVRGLCTRWGTVPHQPAGGKTVWAELPVMIPPSAVRG